jgi:low affinity Fe/Cu permease
MWPYWVAIATLAGAVATLFGVVMKQNRDFQAKVTKIHETHRLYDKERSERISSEHERKDQKLFELGNTSAVMLERVASSLEEMRREARERRDG